MKPLLEGRGAWLLGSTLLIPFFLLGIGVLETAPFIAAAIFLLYLSLLIINFEAGFLTLIFIRSSVDYLKNFTGAGGVNLAAGISLVIIVLGIFYVLYCKVNIFKFEDTGPFLLFIALCGVSVLYSPDLEESVSDWLRLVSIFFVYILSRIVFTTKKKLKILFAVCLFRPLYRFWPLIIS